MMNDVCCRPAAREESRRMVGACVESVVGRCKPRRESGFRAGVSVEVDICFGEELTG